MTKGATVFKNTSCDGKTDLCFKYNGCLYEVDVKLARLTKSMANGKIYSSWRSTSAFNVKPPVHVLLVYPITGTDLSGWYCGWYYKKQKSGRIYCGPPGLENFWD